ncbi:MAG: hypothetical protein M3Q19_16335 [Pseudomonadota bacterium]|nr:hypothetical protein [Pseudomonadota bacterium]
MRPITMMMAAVAGLTLATPAFAQWGHDRTYSHQLQVQFDAGVREGAISRRESFGIREDLSRLVRLERRFSPNGISGREHAILMQRSTSLAKDIRIASRDPNRRGERSAAWDGRASHAHYADPRFAGPHRGDRFMGDTRIGQHASARIVAMPAQYRGEYVDDDRIYYGYDNGRIYKIDRQSQMILALLDIVR